MVDVRVAKQTVICNFKMRNGLSCLQNGYPEMAQFPGGKGGGGGDTPPSARAKKTHTHKTFPSQ